MAPPCTEIQCYLTFFSEPVAQIIIIAAIILIVILLLLKRRKKKIN